MFNLDEAMKIDRIIDYIADLREGQERLEGELAAALDRIAKLEDKVSALTGGHLESDGDG